MSQTSFTLFKDSIYFDAQNELVGYELWVFDPNTGVSTYAPTTTAPTVKGETYSPTRAPTTKAPTKAPLVGE